METLRAEGNALFAAKDYAAAVAKYTQALALQPAELSAPELAAQRVLLWSNRAACALQLDQFESAASDCALALAVEPQNEKARYRRAQALLALGRTAEAFQDVRFVLAVNPSNKAVVALARKIKDVVQSDVHGVQKALDAVAKAADSAAALVGERKAAEDALRFLEMKCVQDLASLPREVEEKGGLELLWHVVAKLLALIEASSAADEPSSAAIDAILSHTVGLLAILASASLPLAAQVYERGGATFAALLALLHRQVEQSYAASTADTAPYFFSLSVAGRKHTVKLAAFVFKHLMLSSDDDAAIRRVLKSVLDGLRSRDVELQISGLDGLLHFISTPSEGDGDAAAKQRKQRFGSLVHELGVFPLLHETAALALHHAQPRHDVLLSRLPLVFTQCLACLAQQESVLKQLVRDHCASPVVAASNASDRAQLATASASCLLLSALFLSNATLALWAVQQSASDGTLFLQRVGEFLVASRSATDQRWLQEIWVDCVASVCGVEGGAGCVPSALRVELAKMLHAALEKEDLVLRASALSILLKIAIVEKTFEPETVDGRAMIDAVLSVLEQAHALEQLQDSGAVRWRSASPKERGIEALSFLITLTPVKDAFVSRRGAVASVFDVAFSSTNSKEGTRGVPHRGTLGYRANVYYGIGYILHHALVSEGTLKRKQMEGMELTPEQYEELQKAMRQKSALDDGDSAAHVQRRVASLVDERCVLATLLQLLKFGTTQSANVVEMAALSALHAADVRAVRGKLVQSGVLAALLPLSRHGTNTGTNSGTNSAKKKAGGTAISTAAGQALAKILISTNPNLVPSASLLSCVAPLLELCRGEQQLLQFEALMALTNIASVSDETKTSIVQGLSTLQYLQFSEHELVRRAATEAICNLLPNDTVIEKVFMNEEKLRLWLAFASVEEEEEDFETARAAAGALAMVAQVPQVSWLLMAQGGLEAFARVIEVATHEETVHRALFAMENLLATLSGEDGDKDELKAQYVATVTTQLQAPLVARLSAIIGGGKHAPPMQEAAQACLAALVQCVATKK